MQQLSLQRKSAWESGSGGCCKRCTSESHLLDSVPQFKLKSSWLKYDDSDLVSLTTETLHLPLFDNSFTLMHISSEHGYFLLNKFAYLPWYWLLFVQPCIISFLFWDTLLTDLLCYQTCSWTALQHLHSTLRYISYMSRSKMVTTSKADCRTLSCSKQVFTASRASHDSH